MIKNMTPVLVVALAGSACALRPSVPPGFQGVVELDEVVLAFETAGRIRTVEVPRGAVVKAGDLLATLDDTLARTARDSRTAEAEAASEQAKVVRAGSRAEDRRAVAAQIRAARAREALLSRQVERTRPLLTAGTVTSAAFDELQSQLLAATADRESLEQRLSQLENGARPEEIAGAEARAAAARGAVALESERVDRFVLRAPAPGVVLEVHAEPGEVVNMGTPVATLADPTHPYVDVFVPEAQVGGLRIGTRARLRVDSVANPLGGAIENIARRTEFTPRFLFSDRDRPALVLRVRVRVEDPEQQLHGGLPAFVEFDPPAGPSS